MGEVISTLRRPSRRARAFTIVELMLTVVLLLILAGVGYFTQKSASEQRLAAARAGAFGSVTTAEQQLASQFGSYSARGDDLQLAAAGLQILDGGPSLGPDQVSLAVGTAGSLGMAVRLDERTCAVQRMAPAASGGQQVSVPVPGSAACVASLAFVSPEIAAVQVAGVRSH